VLITVGTPIFIPDGVPYEYIFISMYRTGNGLAFSQLSEPCYSAAFQIACASKLRPCLQIGNGEAHDSDFNGDLTRLFPSIVTLPYPHQSCRDICQTYRKCRRYWILFNPPLQLLTAPHCWHNIIGPSLLVRKYLLSSLPDSRSKCNCSCAGGKLLRIYRGHHHL